MSSTSTSSFALCQQHQHNQIETKLEAVTKREIINHVLTSAANKRATTTDPLFEQDIASKSSLWPCVQRSDSQQRRCQ